MNPFTDSTGHTLVAEMKRNKLSEPYLEIRNAHGVEMVFTCLDHLNDAIAVIDETAKGLPEYSAEQVRESESIRKQERGLTREHNREAASAANQAIGGGR
jgi:hypothetical protein